MEKKICCRGTLPATSIKYKYKILLDQIQTLEIKDKMRENSEGLFTCEGHQMLGISKNLLPLLHPPPPPPPPSPQVSQKMTIADERGWVGSEKCLTIWSVKYVGKENNLSKFYHFC